MASFTITTETLRKEYDRLSPDWLDRYGFGKYAKIVFMHRQRKTLLIGLQKPVQREKGHRQDFILHVDAIEDYYQYEQDGKERRRSNGNGNGNGYTTQIRVFMIDETFMFMENDYPSKYEILNGGRTETLENIRTKVHAEQERGALVIADGKTGLVLFLDDNLQPRIKLRVGVDPDRDNSKGRLDLSEDVHDELRHRARARLNRERPPVEIVIDDGVHELKTTIANVSAREILDLLTDTYK